MSTGLMDRLDGLAAAFSVLYFCLHTQSFHYTHSVTSHTYVLLNSSNKRACSNIFVNVTLVSRTHINGQKLKENVKRHTRKLLKHMKKTNLKMKKNTQNKKTLMLKTLKDN